MRMSSTLPLCMVDLDLMLLHVHHVGARVIFAVTLEFGVFVAYPAELLCPSFDSTLTRLCSHIVSLPSGSVAIHASTLLAS